jgi:hypothetical protein
MGTAWKWRKRRVVLGLLGLLLVYLFIHNIPTDLGAIDERVGQSMRPGHTVHNKPKSTQTTKEPAGAPPRSSNDEPGPHYYNGPIKFYRLATTLRGIARTGGSKWDNRNLLFAASSLKSVANLIPMACAMGKADRNYVHLALLGRDPLPLEDILQINGVDKDDCPVYFHDARGDYAEFSSDTRAEVAVSGAMKHINDFIHPQAIIMDDSILEDFFFIRAMRKKADEYRRALIEVPEDKYEEFLWMTRLDSRSLGNWFSPSIDILIHAPPDSSGGLIRLLKSLRRADYTGLRPPRLTIELPNDIESFAKGYIEQLQWPPEEHPSPLRTNAISLRHRITTSRLNSEQASLRFVESFFPASTLDDNVLILSPQAELNPLYLQYLYYLILEYRYSAYGSREVDDLLGLSLDVPTNFINGSSGFVAPTASEMREEDDDKPKYQNLDKSDPAPFVYQAPSSAASLIFGDKWTTFHNFLSRRLEKSEAGTAEKHTKQVGESEPAWMEYLLELMTARGWNMLHPAAPMATVHNELARIPEEYMRESKTKDAKHPDSVTQPLADDAFLTADTPPSPPTRIEYNDPTSLMSLTDTLPFDGNLPDLRDLPHIYKNGKYFSKGGDSDGIYQDTYVAWFRQHIGGCDEVTAKRRRVVYWLGADDLFCGVGIVPEFDEAPVEEETVAEVEDESDPTATQSAVAKPKPSSDGPQNRDISGAGEVDYDEGSAEEQDGVQV